MELLDLHNIDAHFIALFFYVAAKIILFSLAGMTVIVSILLILMDAWCIFVDSDVHAFLSSDDSPPARAEKAPPARAKKAPSPKCKHQQGYCGCTFVSIYLPIPFHKV